MGLENAADSDIFDYAKAHGFAIVTFDADFVDLNVVRGMPPKIIWLKNRKPHYQSNLRINEEKH